MLDIDLFYREKGEGEPFILLHGNGDDSSYFEFQLEEFSEYYHVYAIDTRGHGNSPMGERPFTLDQFAYDLYDFMTEKGIEKANILGFSDGGNIAILFALRHPEMIQRLILDGANLFPEGIRYEDLQGIRSEYEEYKRKSGNSFEDWYRYRLMALMVEEPHVNPLDLASFSWPTLVMAGTHDVIADEHTKLIQKSIPGSALYIMEGDHYIASRKHREFNGIVLNFCFNN